MGVRRFYFTSVIVMSWAEISSQLLRTTSRMRVTSSWVKASFSVITVMSARPSRKVTTQSAKPLALILLSSSDSAVMLLTCACRSAVSCSFSALSSYAFFSAFLIESSASSRALVRVKRACSKNSTEESWLALTSWASP